MLRKIPGKLLFPLILISMMICATLAAHNAYAQIKKDAKVKAYDPDASVTCLTNYTYVAAKGCVPNQNRINQFSLDGRSPVIGLARCMPQITEAANPVQTFTGDDMLNDGQVIQLSDGNIIIANSDEDGVFFNRYNANMVLQKARVPIVDIANGIGFAEHNSSRDDNLKPTKNFKIAALDDARWLIVFMARSSQTNKNYILGAVINADAVEEPSVNTLADSDIFPISYEGKLLSDFGSDAYTIPSNAKIEVIGLKAADGTLDGRFMVAWLREDYLKPGQIYSIFGKLYDEQVQETPPSIRYGLEQGGEIRLEGTVGSLQSANMKLVALRSTQGFAFFYNDPLNYGNMFSGASREGAMQLFESDGDIYLNESNVVGRVGNILRVADAIELTSGQVLAVHNRTPGTAFSKTVSATLIDVTTPATPVITDLNGGDAGDAISITAVDGTISSLSATVLPSNRTKVLLTWFEDRTSADSVRAMMVRYDAGTPTIENVSDWFRIDTDSAPYPEAQPTASHYVMSQFLQTLTTPIATEHYFLTKYERATGNAVYRRYIIPNCW